MSGMMHPVGPEPPFVYWARRGAIVLVVIAVVVVLGMLVFGRGSGDDTAAPAPSASASTLASTLPTSTASAAATSDANGEPLPCRDSDIVVEATTDSATYKVGETPRLQLAVTNNSSVACTRDVGPKANSLEITSGGYHVWSSDDCSASDRSKIVTLEPGKKAASSITWDGRLSDPACKTQGAVAKAGRYEVIGRNGEVESDGTPFSLTRKKA